METENQVWTLATKQSVLG